jgi:glutamate-1-semialdehyde 2,1-aminomutase
MGCILPQPGFLEGLRKICDQEQIIFIFDEVMTGFRLARGGAQEKFRINADLVTYGKIIGGGLPVGAFGGKKYIMEVVSPLGNVYQAGTLSGNPIAMIAGYTLLSILNEHPQLYEELDEKTAYLEKGLQLVLKEYGVPHVINHLGSMISLHFSDHPVTNFGSASSTNTGLFKKYFHEMLKRGVYLPPSPFESWFLNNAMEYEDLDATINATRESLKEIMK